MEGIGKGLTVSFADPIVSSVYELAQEDRRSPWEEAARDRVRFQRKIAQIKLVLRPILEIRNMHIKTKV